MRRKKHVKKREWKSETNVKKEKLIPEGPAVFGEKHDGIFTSMRKRYDYLTLLRIPFKEEIR